MRISAVALALACALIGCSSSPGSPRDTCKELDQVAVCAPQFSDEDLELSIRIWGATNDCDDQDAIPIVVAELDGLVGEADANEVRIAPIAWDHQSGAGLTIAHEIGHKLGLGHEDDPCALMAPATPPASCGAVSVLGCSFAISHDS